MGRIESVVRRGDSVILTIAPRSMDVGELALGDSVAVDGTCLTVTELGSGKYQALAGAETLRRTTLGDLRAGSHVNLERALRVGDRLGGHMVMGHVDAVGQISGKRDRGANLEYDFRMPAELLRYVIAKGSIAIDGISLTVNAVPSSGFSVALIPHTVEKTTLAAKGVGARVNLEVDMIGKYVEKLVGGYQR